MTKMWKSLWASMVIVLVVLVPACKTTKKNVKTDTVAETTQPPAPEIAVTTDTATSVAPPADFVQPTAEPAEEPFPSAIDEANKVARVRGVAQERAGIDVRRADPGALRRARHRAVQPRSRRPPREHRARLPRLPRRRRLAHPHRQLRRGASVRGRS